MTLMKPRPIVGGMLFYPARVALGLGILAAYVTLGLAFPVLMAKPLMLLAVLVASFFIYYAIETDPVDDARLAAMPELDRKQLLLTRGRKAHKVGLLLFIVSLVAAYFIWHSMI